jgi:hypothetical protein
MTDNESAVLEALEQLLHKQSKHLTKQFTEPLKSLQLGIEEHVRRLEREVYEFERPLVVPALRRAKLHCLH